MADVILWIVLLVWLLVCMIYDLRTRQVPAKLTLILIYRLANFLRMDLADCIESLNGYIEYYLELTWLLT